MSNIQIASLCVICAGFVIFAVVLAWGDYQTRNVRHAQPAKPQVAAASKLQVPKPDVAAPQCSFAPKQKASAN
jgi:hypothetical protein